MPNVPDFRNLDRQQRAATDRFSVKNVIGQTFGQSVAPPPIPSLTPTPSVTPTITPTATVTPTPTVTVTPSITPTPTLLPIAYQTPPWNFTTYIYISGGYNSLNDYPLEIWRISQFNSAVFPSGFGTRVTYSPTYAPDGNVRLRLFIDGAGTHQWQKRDTYDVRCLSKTINPALSTVTVTKLPGSADGWVYSGDCGGGNTTTLYISGFN